MFRTKIQKIASLVMSIMMMVSSITVASAAPQAPAVQTDIEGHWAADHIVRLHTMGIMKGDSSGAFRPSEPITRAEFTALVVRLFGIVSTADITKFKDMKNDQWYYTEIAKGVSAGIINGKSDSQMDPEGYITRAEAATILTRAYELEPDSVSNISFRDADQFGWAARYLNAMANEGYMVGNDGYMRPQDYITRAEVARLLSSMTGEILTSDVEDDVLWGNVLLTRDRDLKNVTINGNLYITGGVLDGNVELDNVTVNGKLIVQGGGDHSVKLKGKTTVKQGIVIHKVVSSVPVHMVIGSEVEISRTGSQADIEINSHASVEIEGSDAFAGSVNISGPHSLVNLAGQFETVSITGSGISLTLAEGVNIGELRTQSPVQITFTNTDGTQSTITMTGGQVATVKSGVVSVEAEEESVESAGDSGTRSPSRPSGPSGPSTPSDSSDLDTLQAAAKKIANISMEDGTDVHLLHKMASLIDHPNIRISLRKIEHEGISGSGKAVYRPLDVAGTVTVQLTLNNETLTVNSEVLVKASDLGVMAKEYDTPGTYSQTYYYGISQGDIGYVDSHARISASGVTLSGVEIKGNLYVNKNVESVVLNNVRVGGEIIAFNGASTAIIIQNSTTFGELNRTAIHKDYVYGDAMPNAPELSARGDYGVGVRTIYTVDENRDDRPLSVEVWYPAIIPEGAEEITVYDRDVLGRGIKPNRPLVPVDFIGRALRDAEPDTSGGAYPLVIYSHGDPGFSVMISYLAENLASKGYVVAAIDHKDSLHSDMDGVPYAAYKYRADDIEFVIRELEQRGNESSDFLYQLADTRNVALIGYSNGGQGVINVAGAGYTLDASITDRRYGHEAYENSEERRDMLDRVKAVIAAAPNMAPFSEDSLQGITAPMLWIGGNKDNVVGFNGIRNGFNHTINAERYMLVYKNVRHNPIANMPPRITVEPGVNPVEFTHYQEPAWDQTRLNNINQHFVTAFLNKYLKGDTSMDAYLQLPIESNDHTGSDTWYGFPENTALGMQFYYAAKGTEGKAK